MSRKFDYRHNGVNWISDAEGIFIVDIYQPHIMSPEQICILLRKLCCYR